MQEAKNYKRTRPRISTSPPGYKDKPKQQANFYLRDVESILQSSSALARWPGWCCKHMRMADRNFAPNLFGTCRRMRSIDKSRIIPCGSSGCAEVHAKRQQPKAQMSAAGVTGWPSSTSGAMIAGVPQSVRPKEYGSPGALGILRIWKPVTTARPLASKCTFRGFRLRCVTPAMCIARSAAATSRAHWSIVSFSTCGYES